MATSLREITRANLSAVLRLKTTPEQRSFVADNAVSIAQAHFYPESAWFRAIYDEDEPAGFVMMAFEPDNPPYVWRLMVNAAHQRRGIGKAAMQLIEAHVRAAHPTATEIRLSIVPGPGSPGPFYEGLGYCFNGEVEDGELVMCLPLPPLS